MLGSILLSLLAANAVVAVPLESSKPPAWIPGPTTGTDELARNGLSKLEAYLQTNAGSKNSSCTLKTAHRRKEWDDLVPDQKKEYIAAVRCLQTLPAISGESAPGARSRYDDFVVVHIDGTASNHTIHNTGVFLSWHRQYIWAFEEALRNECNYTGYQPYVKFGRYSNSVIGAPIFDGSETSLSGNGKDVPHGPIPLTAPESSPNGVDVEIPALPGGGCVTDGPFVNYTVTLGPRGLASINDTKPNPLPNGKGYNPRCMRRSLNVISASGVSDANCTKLITESPNIELFQDWMQGPFDFGTPEYGVHAAAHYMVGGDPGGDFFTSPGDVFFWFLHAEIDRLWWIWQMQDFGGRVGQIAGTFTPLNFPASRNVTLDDVVDLGGMYGYEAVRIGDIVDTMGGEFCYIYE
ncbi:related to tyrosinase [Ramularia collo-cygni]|uniref:Related to tyrosinase n=1 Tax=Ramularia collo-cygni TaxID=112498 RepID=A0A2D3URD8_9PEZI|nr:related to tyrosinase [Ramularia collo-cygni]CZT14970.1 related to tyrosinase [Ramularia collo-cygni]